MKTQIRNGSLAEGAAPLTIKLTSIGAVAVPRLTPISLPRGGRALKTKLLQTLTDRFFFSFHFQLTRAGCKLSYMLSRWDFHKKKRLPLGAQSACTAQRSRCGCPAQISPENRSLALSSPSSYAWEFQRAVSATVATPANGLAFAENMRRRGRGEKRRKRKHSSREGPLDTARIHRERESTGRRRLGSAGALARPGAKRRWNWNYRLSINSPRPGQRSTPRQSDMGKMGHCGDQQARRMRGLSRGAHCFLSPGAVGLSGGTWCYRTSATLGGAREAHDVPRRGQTIGMGFSMLTSMEGEKKERYVVRIAFFLWEERKSRPSLWREGETGSSWEGGAVVGKGGEGR